MSFADIEELWRSRHNRSSPDDIERHRERFVADLRRRHRGFVAFATIVGAVLGVVTIRLLAHLIAPAAGDDPVELAREWSIVALLLLPWIGWVWLLNNYRRHRARHPDYSRSIQASVRAQLDETRMQRSRGRIVLGLLVAMLALLPLVVYQLRAVVKAGDEILFPAFVLFPLIEAGIVVGLVYRDRRRLRPRQRELESLLRAYAATENPER